MRAQERRYVLFSSPMRGVVSDHQHIHGSLGCQSTSEFPVVGGQTYATNLSFVTEPIQLLSQSRGEFLFLQDSKEEEHINVFGAQLAESLLQRPAQVRVAQYKVVSACGNHVLFTVTSENVAKHMDHLCIEPVSEEVVDSLVQCPVDGGLSWAVAG
jgi:hypothetical protein